MLRFPNVLGQGYLFAVMIKTATAMRIMKMLRRRFWNMSKTTAAISILLTLLCVSQAYAFCFEEAGKEYGVDPTLLWTVAKIESNFNPWAINYNSNGTYDFGLMQINSSWYNSLGKDLWQKLADPCTNVRVGAWIMSDCFKRYGNMWKAVGCYNASSENKRAKYAWKIYKQLNVALVSSR